MGKAIPLPEWGCSTMTIVIAVDGVDGITLTDEHAASSYGQLVVVDDQGNGHGPGDPAPGDPSLTARELVRGVVAATDCIGRLRTFIGGG